MSYDLRIQAFLLHITKNNQEKIFNFAELIIKLINEHNKVFYIKDPTEDFTFCITKIITMLAGSKNVKDIRKDILGSNYLPRTVKNILANDNIVIIPHHLRLVELTDYTLLENIRANKEIQYNDTKIKPNVNIIIDDYYEDSFIKENNLNTFDRSFADFIVEKNEFYVSRSMKLAIEYYEKEFFDELIATLYKIYKSKLE